MKTNRINNIILLASIIIGTQSCKPKQLEDRFKYDIEELKMVDSNEICYKESSTINIDNTIPKGICIDKNDNLYFLGLGSISIFDKNQQKINEIDVPDGNTIACDNNFVLYIASNENIYQLDTTGKILLEWTLPQKECVITSIAAYNNHVFIADAGNRIVYHYNNEGKLEGFIGQKNESFKGFIIPSASFDLAIKKENELWVVNPGMHMLVQFDFDGNIIKKWTKTSMQIDGFSGCCNPAHIALLKNGSFVTSEKGLVRIKIHGPTGNYKCMVAGPDSFNEETKGTDLAVNSRGIVYALDKQRMAIRKFERK